MKWLKYITAVLLTLAMAAAVTPLPAQSGRIQYCMNIKVIVDGEEICSIPAFDADYENHMYISLTGLSNALQGTGKSFVPTVTKQEIRIVTDGGDAAAEDAPEAYVWAEEDMPFGENVSLSKNKLYVDEAEKKYYSAILQHDKKYDAFLSAISLAMLFDMDIKVTEDAVEIHTETPFSVTADALENSGYLQGVNALLIGDGTTGEIYYAYDADTAFPIASTTKLMTYFVFMDAVAQGKCSLEDTVTISEQAAVLSKGPDGVIPMKEGRKIPVRELLYGMLIPSSNECALALAEHAAGSHEAFVQLMNAKAAELGLEHTAFYNCHGLPNYEDQLIPAKTHNHMTAEEMFILASALVDAYPQVTEFTSEKEYHMESFDRDIKNTNPLLYNLDRAVGLKTGTTNKAGSCLVTCVLAEKDGASHNLITVLFGADGDINRGIASEIAARYAEEVLKAGASDHRTVHTGGAETENGIPQDPEAVVRRLLAGFLKISFG